jgi:PKD repeat protein
LTDPLNPRCKVTDLEKDVIYFFVVTAYDTEGNESDFSNIISSDGDIAHCARSKSSEFVISTAQRIGAAPLTVAFTDSSTGNITSWSWDFDNDCTEDGTSRNPIHTFSEPGTYTVTLKVTGPGGLYTATRTYYITVTAAHHLPPAIMLLLLE